MAKRFSFRLFAITLISPRVGYNSRLLNRNTQQVKQDTAQQALKQLSLGLGMLGLCLGFLAAYGVLAGDVDGRVNLLFLLLLFAFLPVSGLLLSIFLMVKGGGKGLAGWILDIPLWPRHLILALSRLGPTHGRELWLFYQTQILAVSFSVGCLLLYLLLLLGSDITFVWRSTLLEPENLLPALKVIGTPWRFWTEAQASLALIEQTRDFRLDSQGMSQPVVGLWWKYILATQLAYNLLPRSLMLLVARQKYRARLQQSRVRYARDSQPQLTSAAADENSLANLARSVASPYTLLDWADVSSSCYERIQQLLGDAAEIYPIGPLQHQAATHLPGDHSLVVVVKSWEPPLAELADRLNDIDSNADKLVLPLDWSDTGVRQPSPAHLDEWRRFAATLDDWQVLQLETLI
ncbi:MAG: hypothetical protein DRR06_11610 [Gammaproteobacteria bacterium]|nr:MAG: hypothetical protein DRR06_11610 [Gammaproteobacteria bacterium]